MTQMFRELLLATRYLGRNKGTTAAAILTMALGIGACTAIFSVVQGVLLKPLPYPDPGRIMQIWQVSSRGGGHMQTSDPNFLEWREQSSSFKAIAEYSSGVLSILGGAEPVRARVGSVSQGFFDILGVAPSIGRSFEEEELQAGGSPAVIVSHGFWQRFLNSDPDLSSRRLTFSNRTHQVIGVMPPGFSFPVGAELWIPREILPWNESRTSHNWYVLGRLAPGVSLERARQEMHGIGHRQHETYGEDIWLQDIDLVPLREQMVGNVRTQLLLLLGAVGFLLLVACANVTNLLLARISSRRKELALRAALGAGSWDLTRQFLFESLLMTLAGGALGVGLSALGVRLLLQLEPGNLPRLGEVEISIPVLGFALALSLLTGLVLGLLPLLRTLGPGIFLVLKESGRGQTSGTSSTRLRNSLVICEVALTAILLVGAGLLGRSFLKLLDVDPGFRIENRVMMEVSNPDPRDRQEHLRLAASLDEIMQRLKRLPGVSQVGGINSLPLRSSFSNGEFVVAHSYEEWAFALKGPLDWERIGKLMNVSEKGYAEYRLASKDYFQSMGIPLIRGRWFEDRDTADSAHVCLISQSLADKQWAGQDPIGKLIQFGNMDGDLHVLRVVGVVGDVRDYGVDSQVRPTIYLDYKQRPGRASDFTIVMNTALPPESIIGSARSVVRELNPNLPVQFSTIDQVFSSSLADRRFGMLLLSIFGVAALSLAAIGIFAVMAYTVAQRTQEIGVRIALGAAPGSVRGLVVRRGLRIAGAGVLLGLLGALALTRLLSSMLFGIGSLDPAVYALAVPLLLLVSFLACYLPAFRASRVDPLAALRV